jgi:ribosome-associated translation inhibitor RaiA
MLIQLNTDKNLTIHAEYEAQINEKLNKELERFSSHIGRLEVHLSDENGSKSGLLDKRCMLEARIEGRAPIAVTNLDQNYDLAMHGAIAKLKSSLTTILGKLQEKQH